MRACAIVSARTTRQKRVQSMMTMAAITEWMPEPKTATSRMERSTGGKAIQMSTSREMMASARPPYHPATSPSAEPSRAARVAATTATVSAMRLP